MSVSSAVDLSAIARVVGIATQFKNLRAGNVVYLPQRVAVIGQGATAATYSTLKQQFTRASDVGSTYGFGSPLHLAAKQLLPTNGDGVGTIPVTFYPLLDDGAGVASASTITPGGAATGGGSFRVRVNNILSAAFLIATSDSVAAMVTKITAAINAITDMPVVAADNATNVGLTSKWKGASSLAIVASFEGDPTPTGVTFAFTAMAGGATNPSVQPALDQIGLVWETMLLNCMNLTDTATLDLIAAVGEGRWGALVRKPFVSFVGDCRGPVGTVSTVPDARKTDRTNATLIEPGSKDLPFVAAARQLARIAVVANNDPARDYGGQSATGLTPGVDSVQWLYPDRDIAVKKGTSTIEVRDGVVTLGDIVTMFHPSNDPTPAYRYVCDIVKLQNIIFNLDLIFATQEWNGAPLIPDDQPTVNAQAKKPKTARAAIAALIDSLGLNAIISDPETAKKLTIAVISDQNPKRLDVSMTIQLCGNTNIISVDLNFGFFFGTLPLVA